MCQERLALFGPCYRSSAVISLMLLWLRAVGLVGQAVSIGGAIFAVAVVRPSRPCDPARAFDRVLALVTWGALLAAAAQAGVLVVLAKAMENDAGWPLSAVLDSTVGVIGFIRIAVALAGAAVAHTLRRHPDSTALQALLVSGGVLLALSGALASHAVGRIDGGVWLVFIGALHQAAAATWVGGLVCATVLALRSPPAAPETWLRPFSRLALAAVAVLALTGAALSLVYIATPAAAIGTSYGAMTLAKIVLFMAMLTMGALNHRAVHGRLGTRRRLPSGASPAPDPSRSGSLVLSRRLEVEAGLAIVTIFLAASIGSAPPAADMQDQRATLAEIRSVFTPQWPRLSAPSLAELAAATALGDPSTPHSAEETAWSEFGHHVAGLFVVAMGVLAMLERTGWAPWARHWPLLLIGLTGFVAWNMDPEGWQTGRIGFWEHLMGLEVLQHRILLALMAILAVAEWRVRSGRHPDSAWRYVFPLVCVGAGVLLLSHAHEVSNAKAAFLIELTHLPLGLVILVAGWSRWLELRLSPPDNVAPGRLWAPALTVFGLLLLFYRES
jgi:copper resistance protein D